jgi:prepilin-type N-terminal cleavage/methylation domain-containing protein
MGRQLLSAARLRFRRAFTLLELLLSMSLVVVIAATLATSLAAAFKARTTGEQSVQSMRSATLVMEAIRADLQGALPPSRGLLEGTFEGVNQQIANNIEADDLVYYAATPSPYHPEGSNGEIKEFELTCYQPTGSTDYVLVRRTLNNLIAPTGGALALPTLQSVTGSDEEILCRNVLGFTLQYFDGTEWQPAWDSTQYSNSLPAAVMVTLVVAGAEKDAGGKPIPVTYTRIFALPCTGQPSGSTSGGGALP